MEHDEIMSTIILLIAGLALLIVGAEALVRGASRMAASFGISPLVIGLTVVAFGTSSPELAVSVQSAYAGQANIAFGNVVGSNIFNVLFILGISAAITPLVVARQLVRLDVPLMIGVSLLVYLLGWNGEISRLEGGLLFAGMIAYTAFSIRQSRKESQQVRDEYAAGFGGVAGGTHQTVFNMVLIAVGLGLLILGARWLVDSAVSLAQALGLSELIIGLTIIAAGTSMPEVATSIVAAVRGERDIAVGNVVGSNIFNLMAVLGLTGLVAPDGVSVPAPALAFDLPVMIAVAFACMPIFFTGFRVARWEGWLFLTFYGLYVLYLILDAAQHDTLPLFSSVMLLFVVPLTAITLLVLVVRERRARRGANGGGA